jgi:hypothetical protein
MPLGRPTVGSDRLVDVFRPTAHNAFDPGHAASLRGVLSTISSVEIDFWDDETAPWLGARPNAWFVRHLPASGNVSNGTPPGDLKACLLDIAGSLRSNPVQNGAFVFLDKQQGWGPTRNPEDLDALLVEVFGASIFRPVDLIGTFDTPRTALQNRGWCTLDDLADRVSFVLTGGRWGDGQTSANSVLAKYVNSRRRDSVCFVAPEIRKQEEILGNAAGFTDATTQWVVMFNYSNQHIDLSPAVHAAGLISRVYYAATSDEAYQECVTSKVNFIAIDAFSEHGWNDNLMTGRFPS